MTDIEILLDRTQRHAVEFLNGLDRRPVHPTATLKELRRRLGAPLEDCGKDAAQVIDDLVAATSGGHVGSVSVRSFAWVMGGVLPSALAAEQRRRLQAVAQTAPRQSRLIGPHRYVELHTKAATKFPRAA